MIESKLDELAWRCLTRPDSVRIEDLGLTPSDVHVSCEYGEKGLMFRDPEETRSRAIRYIQQTVIVPATVTPPTLFDSLERCWFDARDARQDCVVERALTELHNAGEVDAIRMAIEAMQDGCDVFTVSSVMARSLPTFDRIDVPDLLVMLGLMYPQMKNDLVSGYIYESIMQWMGAYPAAIDVVVSSCLAAPDESSAHLLRAALVQGVGKDRSCWLSRVYELVHDKNSIVNLAAIEALGLVDWSCAGAEETTKAAAVIRVGLRSGDESVLLSSARAALNMISTTHDQHILIDEIVALNESYIVRLVGDYLGYRAEHLKVQPWYQEKITLLAGKTGQDKGSCHGVDAALSKLFKSSHKAVCLQWLHAWAVANASAAMNFPEEFPQLFRLLSKNGEELGTLLAKWLLHDEVGVQKMARHLLAGVDLHGGDELIFPATVLDDMAPSKLLHLVRRVLGNVFREGQQISLIWSLAGTAVAEEQTFGLVRDAIVNFVGRDYPVATRAYLESVVSGEPKPSIERLAQSILATMREYQDALDALPMAEELRPLAEHGHRFAKERHRKMNKAFDEASKHSILRQIATTIPLKAGRSSFSVRGGEVGKKMNLSSISHSVAIPRSEAIDRVGSDRQRVQFNLGREGHE